MCQINFLRGKGYPLRRNAGYVLAALVWLGDGDSCLIQEMQFGSTNRSSNIKLIIDDDINVRIPTPKIAHTFPLVMYNGYNYSYNFQSTVAWRDAIFNFYLLHPYAKKCIIKQEKCHQLSISEKYCDILQSIHHFSFYI